MIFIFVHQKSLKSAFNHHLEYRDVFFVFNKKYILKDSFAFTFFDELVDLVFLWLRPFWFQQLTVGYQPNN